MNYKIKEGNYEKQGVQQLGKWTIFTFEGEKEDDCSVALLNNEKEVVEKIEVPKEYCMGSLRSVAVENLKTDELLYMFEVNGKRVLDPYAHRIVGREVWNDEKRMPDAVYGAFVPSGFAWGDDRSPEIDRSQMIMYKLHVRGFSMDAKASTTNGTFQAVSARIPYLQEIGVTTVELMPVYEFEERIFPEEKVLPDYIQWEAEDADMIVPPEETKVLPKLNFWGYTKGNYFAVKSSYARNAAKASMEYKALIRKLHQHGMECVMEFFFLEGTDQNLILAALRFWVMEYHVDGFHLLGENLPMTAIAQDKRLSRTKIFYTDFGDAGEKERSYRNLYVYKDEYQYPARKMLNHFGYDLDEFIDQQRKQGSVLGFVNYISDNNGFTLADLFMYNERHNEDNGENNCDGNAWNFSNNYGVEGPTAKRYINRLRKRQWRNAILMIMMAQGVPLLWSGDEFGNSQAGNNNAYCQDNPIGWINWKSERSRRDQKLFFENVARFRREHPILANPMPFQFCDYKALGCPDLSFHGENAWMIRPQGGGLALGMLYCGAYSVDAAYQEDVYVAYNFSASETVLALPGVGKTRQWYLQIDSSDDKTPYLAEPKVCAEGNITLPPHTIRVLAGREVPQHKKRKERGSKAGI